MKYINENIQTWMTRKLKIAIIGNSGTGKSSLINAIMGRKPGDEGAAQVGVTETTFGIQEYVLPSNENISLWDLPGVGTQNFKKEDYLKTVKLETFDVFMIVSASRFTENDIWLATEILSYQSRVLVIRTKIDVDLSNAESDYPSTYKEANCLHKIKMEIVKNLEKASMPHKRSGIYLISSRKTSKYDFTNLVNRLNGILSKKRFALKGVIEHHLQEISSRKRDRKKRQFLLSQVCILFGVGCEYEHTRMMYDNCKAAFSLDDKTLELISQEIGMSVEHLKTEELKFFQDFEEKLERSDLTNWFQLYLKRLEIYITFKNRLHDVCDVLSIDEAKLINLRLKHLEKQLQPL